MYKNEKSLVLKSSASALCNNLSVQVNQSRNEITYAVVHKSVVNLVSASTDGASVNHRQIVCKEPSASAVHGGTIVLQARLVQMAMRCILVITSQKGIQMFEADGSLMLYWYALGDGSPTEAQACFGRGIVSVEDDTVCVGTHEGLILSFYVPPKGTNITLSESLKGHKVAICDLESAEDRMVSSDILGNITVWHAGNNFKAMTKINGAGYPCTSVVLFEDVVVGGYGSGHIRVFNSSNGAIMAEVTAHAKALTSLDIARRSGMLLSTSEDSFLHVWQLRPESSVIEHKFSQSITDVQLQGGKFITEDGRAIGVTGYDSNEIVFFKR